MRPGPLWRRHVGLGALVIAEIAWLAAQSHLQGLARWIPVIVVLVGHVHLVAVERRDPILAPGYVAWATVVVAVGAVVITPFGSRDLFQYAMYGRMAAVHHLSPYSHAPAAVPHDRFLAQLAPPWRGTRSVYGPAFTALSAVGARGFGSSPLLARLYFQAIAGTSLAAATWLLRRRGAPSSVLILVGLSPVLVATVNGGHNDVLVGFLALLGVDHFTRAKPGSGALMLAIACSVKLSALPVVAAVVVALMVARRWRVLARTSMIFIAVVAGGYAIAGGRAALEPLGSLGSMTSRVSAWRVLELLHGRSGAIGASLGGAAAGLVALGALVIIGRFLRRGPPFETGAVAGLAVALGVLACFGSPYVLPWYPAAFLPLSAYCIASMPQRALTVGSAAILLAYVQPPGQRAAELMLAPGMALLASLVVGLALVAAVFGSIPRRGLAGDR